MVLVPDLTAEAALWARGFTRIAGVDEVGLGSLSGPVVAAAVIVPPGCAPLAGVRDSKTLSAVQRLHLYHAIRSQALAVGVAAASVAEIDGLNVLRATHTAMARALAQVAPCEHALIDGRPIKTLDLLGSHTAIVDGDASCYAIACASIVAKVVRDRLMRLHALRFPGYGWEHNAGYGTPEHLEALRRLGVTALHRRSFAPVRAVLDALPTQAGRAASRGAVTAT